MLERSSTRAIRRATQPMACSKKVDLWAIEGMPVREPGFVLVENFLRGIAGPEHSRFARRKAGVPVLFIELVEPVFGVASVCLSIYLNSAARLRPLKDKGAEPRATSHLGAPKI